MAASIYTFYRAFQPYFRRRRWETFIRRMQPIAGTRILDVGGNIYDWEGVPTEAHVTVTNLQPDQTMGYDPARFATMVADGRKLPFADGSFDIVYANSVIEHLGEWEHQQAFAAEMQRVGRRVFVQTPNRWFPIEPHFIAPFVHFLPKRYWSRILPRMSLRSLLQAQDNVSLTALAAELRLLSRREMQVLFPSCEIVTERVVGLAKSFIAIR